MWQSIIDFISKVNSAVNNVVWGIPMIIAILFTGVLLTIRTHFMQVKKFNYSLNQTIIPTVKSLGKKDKNNKNQDKKKKSVSQFEAFSAAISGTIGTGNIAGVATALVSGGAGAIFWMWISAFFGMMTNYSENILGIYFRKKNKYGDFCGGPMYYISEGLKAKWLAVIFAVFCSLAAIGYGGVQVNTIAQTLKHSFDVPTVVTGLIVAFIVALVIIGGIKRIGKVASYIVPFMTLLFIIMALICLGINVTAIPNAFAMIFKNAFSFQAVGGGIMGFAIMKAMRYGFARGVFSNEAGLGSSVIAHSASDVKEPVQQGLWGIFEVFLDTMVICTLMALIILSTGVIDGSGLNGANLAQLAFTNTFGFFGKIIFSIMLPLFAFTTILAWSYYGSKAIEYLSNKIGVIIFKSIYVLLIVLGATLSLDLVWDLSDTFNALMAIPNLISLILMSGLVSKITKNYFDRKKGIDVKPMLSAYPEENDFLSELIKKEDNLSK